MNGMNGVEWNGMRQLRSIRYLVSIRQSSSRSSLLWSFAVWTMVTVRWLVFRSSTTFNDASRTQPLV